MSIRSLVFLFSATSMLWSANPAPAVKAEIGTKRPLQVGDFDRVIPQFVDGDGWQTSIILQSVVAATVHYRIFFSDDKGGDLEFDFEGIGRATSITGQLGPGQLVEIKTTGSSAALVQGYASMFNFDRPPDQTGARLLNTFIGGYAIFRQRQAGRPDQEAVVPFSSAAERQFFIPFDNRDGFASGIALVNDTNQGGTLTTTVLDPAGNVITSEAVPMAAGAKFVYTVKDRFPATAGRNGSLFFSISSAGLSGLGLRFNPTGSFTSTHPLSY